MNGLEKKQAVDSNSIFIRWFLNQCIYCFIFLGGGGGGAEGDWAVRGIGG